MLTLKDPKFFTEHANLTFLPAGTVTFSITSVNSGSSVITVNRMKEKHELIFKSHFNLTFFLFG